MIDELRRVIEQAEQLAPEQQAALAARWRRELEEMAWEQAFYAPGSLEMLLKRRAEVLAEDEAGETEEIGEDGFLSGDQSAPSVFAGCTKSCHLLSSAKPTKPTGYGDRIRRCLAWSSSTFIRRTSASFPLGSAAITVWSAMNFPVGYRLGLDRHSQ